MCDRCGCVFVAPCIVDSICVLLCQECSVLYDAEIKKDIVEMAWARAVSAWNKGQIWNEEMYGIPKRGGDAYSEVKAIMAGVQKVAEPVKAPEKKEQPVAEFSQAEYAEIQREYRKKLAEDDAALIEEGLANAKIKQRHQKWLNGEANDTDTMVLVTQMIRKDFPNFKVLSKKEQKEKQVEKKEEPAKETKEPITKTVGSIFRNAMDEDGTYNVMYIRTVKKSGKILISNSQAKKEDDGTIKYSQWKKETQVYELHDDTLYWDDYRSYVFSPSQKELASIKLQIGVPSK